jgi:hypothetical protein
MVFPLFLYIINPAWIDEPYPMHSLPAIGRTTQRGISTASPKRRVRMSIEKFNSLLHSEKKESALLEALFDLTAIEKPEILVKAVGLTGWGYWV